MIVTSYLTFSLCLVVITGQRDFSFHESIADDFPAYDDMPFIVTALQWQSMCTYFATPVLREHLGLLL